MKKSKLGPILKNAAYSLSTLWFLIFIFVFFCVVGRNFHKAGNLVNIVNQASFLAIIGVAQLVVILTGGVNLSIGSLMALTTVAFGAMMKTPGDFHYLVPVFGVIALGGVVGVFNGLMVAKLSIPAFLATFATMYIARGAAWIYIGKGIFYGIDKDIRFFAMGTVCRIGAFRITMPMLITTVFLIVMAFVLKKTNFGRRLYFTGSNPVAARFSGVNTDRIIIYAHILSGVISGFAGVMYVARLNAAEPNLGVTFHFDAISVALIGGAIMAGGVGSVWGVACGSLITSVIQSGMNNLKVATELQATFLGVIIIAAVYFNTILQDRKMKTVEEIIDDGAEEPGCGERAAGA